MKSTKVVLNNFGGGTLERRIRTSASGKSSDRYTVTLDAKPLALNFDTKTLGAGLALRISQHLQKRVSEISAVAADTTQLRRKHAATAMQRGMPWATKRYSGGRTGPKEPNQSPRLFNDSGRLAEGIKAGATKDNNWVINVPANRLNPASLGSEAALKTMVDRLRQYVPEFGDANALVQVPEIQEEIKRAVDAVYAKEGSAAQKRMRELTQTLVKMVLTEATKADEE